MSLLLTPLNSTNQMEASGVKQSSAYPYTARAVVENGSLADIVLSRDGREIRMQGPAGRARELAVLSGCSAFSPAKDGGGESIPVLIGSGTGAALEEALNRLSRAYGENFTLAVVDREEPILTASKARERFASCPNIVWISSPTAAEAIRSLTRLQEKQGGKALLPLLNPLYLRLDREYYNEVFRACEASQKANFWQKAHYPKFRQEQPRILLLTSQYFLIGEIIGACKRLGVPHRLLQVPEAEVGQNDFVETLLAAVLEFKPDFLFTINHLGVDREGVLTDLLERLRLPLASWFVDNPHLILYLYARLVSPWTSIFTWDADNIESLKALGFSHVSYLPLGVDATRFRPPERPAAFPGLPPGWDRQVSFVGNSMVHKVRKRIDRSRIPPQLVDAYPALAEGFAGSRERSVRAYLQTAHPEYLPAFDALPTNEDRLNYETLLTWQATLRYRLSCIQGILPFHPLIVGDSGWKSLLPEAENNWHYLPEMGYYDQLPSFYPCSAVNFNCTSKQMKGAVNQRVFDVPATESFLLTDYREQVESLFEPGREIVCYRSPEEARELAREYLAQPDKRRKIARAARKRILAEHCYEHRITRLIAEMRKLYG